MRRVCVLIFKVWIKLVAQENQQTTFQQKGSILQLVALSWPIWKKPVSMDPNIDPEVSKYQIDDDGVEFLEEERIKEMEAAPDSNDKTHLEAFTTDDSHLATSGTAEAALSLLNNLHKADQQDELNVATISPPEYMDMIHEMRIPKHEIKLVQYDPDGKALRLGRPRKHIAKPPSPPETSSNKNYNEAVMSKFRFDSQPVEGPGSRGGKNLRKETRGKITLDALKKRHQSILNFAVVKPTSAPNTAPIVKENEKEGGSMMVKVPEKVGVAPPATEKKRKLTSSLTVNPVRRALEKRNPKALPSPLIPISSMEDFLVQHDKSRLKSTNKLALGYPIQKAPYANDIMYLVSFLSKFKEIIPIKNLGPKSFEEGLSLPALREQAETPRFKLKETPFQNASDYDVNYVSPEMEELLKRLLTLVLNRKKDVVSASSAIQELKPQSSKLGLPKEWKLYSPAEREAYDAGEPVDPTHPDILITEFPRESDFVITFNPFYTNEFESKGLRGLSNPLDRLLILKTLAQWSLSTSDSIKNYINQNVQNQELPGDKDTYYASRALLYGFDNCRQAKTKADARLSKMKSTEDDLKYVDPTSDPTAHSMNLRLVDHLVGDLGFYAGRFYLCRMADGENGGLSSVNKMSAILKGQDVGLGTVPPSDFKLYVQDTYLIFIGSAKADGVEFDEDGNEVENVSYRNFDDSEHWYEVASTAEELKAFIDYLEVQLQDTEKYARTSDLYYSVLRLREYLSELYPLIEKQEVLQTTSRQKRKRTIDYSDSRAAAKYNDTFGEVDEEGFADNGYDDGNYIDEDIPANDSEDDEYVD